MEVVMMIVRAVKKITSKISSCIGFELLEMVVDAIVVSDLKQQQWCLITSTLLGIWIPRNSIKCNIILPSVDFFEI